MRVILVDDEPLALQQLELLLKRMQQHCTVIGTFLNFQEALEAIERLHPDVVFLDIHMPGTNGLVAAQIIQKRAMNTFVVFVTAYSNYALNAFEVEAVDYLLKPVSEERFQQTIRRLGERVKLLPPSGKETFATLCCMGRLQIRLQNGETAVLKWRTSKVKELFAYLLHNRNQVISKDKLLQLLWPDADEQKGLVSLQTSIYRIRGELKKCGMDEALSISYSEFGYILKNNGLLIDVEEWERRLSQLPPLTLRYAEEYWLLLEQCKGDYFGEEQYFWAEMERQRLKSIKQQYMTNLAELYAEHNDQGQALSVYHQLIKNDALLEQAYFAIMRIYAQQQDNGAVEKHYHLLRETLRQEADLEPSQEVQNWYLHWKKG